MSLRFLFWVMAVSLIFSATAGWIFLGDHVPGPEAAHRISYEQKLQTERHQAEVGGVEAWTRYAESLVKAPEKLADAATAMIWYRKAADKGYGPAQLGIGELYEHGLGVRQDYYRAQEWYALATRLSRDPEAYFKVGEGYFRGRGLPQDYGMALPYYRKAAKQGHPVAQFIIGSMYEAGWGVERDLIEAWIWYKLALPQAARVAAHQQDYDVAGALTRIEKHMNQSQITTAGRRFAAMAK